MQVFVKVKPDNKTVVIDAAPSDDILVISERVFVKLNINPETDLVNNPEAGIIGYKVVFTGKILQAGRTLSDYNIQKETDGDIILILNRKSGFDKVLTGLSSLAFWTRNNSQPQRITPAAAGAVPAIEVQILAPSAAPAIDAQAPAIAQVPAAVMPEKYNLSEIVDSDSYTSETDYKKPFNK